MKVEKLLNRQQELRNKKSHLEREINLLQDQSASTMMKNLNFSSNGMNGSVTVLFYNNLLMLYCVV